jgi:hypothetical protein
MHSYGGKKRNLPRISRRMQSGFDARELRGCWPLVQEHLVKKDGCYCRYRVQLVDLAACYLSAPLLHNAEFAISPFF